MSQRNPGRIIQLEDGRKVIIYTRQPLLAGKGKVIYNLLNEDLSLQVDDSNKPKIIIKDILDYNKQIQQARLIGYVD